MQALYRKYRPQDWQSIVGQEHVVSVLKNEAEKEKVSHAYLFSGSRGTGKTSIARIFAKSLGVNPEDIYEIDAASNRGIDDVRSIRDAVHVLPYSSKYKVYIVDEAHMLTKDAWNAFLKTLEEPPEHVIFIMATTEPHKLPDTVVSRCESFAFKKPSHLALVETILKVAKSEGVTIAKNSASLVATLAEGSFRDALSILQKAINSSKDKKLSEDEIEEVLGAPSTSKVVSLIEAVGEGKADDALTVVREVSEANRDMQVFLTLIIRLLRFVLLLRFAKDMKVTVQEEVSEEDFTRLEALAKSARSVNSKTLIHFLDAQHRQSFAATPELPIELAILESCGEEK